jgi:Protein of unknown function (DUF3225)
VMEVNIPEVLAELKAVFAAYEKALVSNDVTALNALFRDAKETIRYGSGENLYGYEEIAAFRAGRSPIGLARKLDKTEITTYGRDFGVASTLFRRDSAPGRVGRQMQTWMRTDKGWKVIAAHVSIIPDQGV